MVLPIGVSHLLKVVYPTGGGGGGGGYEGEKEFVSLEWASHF